MARQFNLNGFNGLHLKAPYDYTTYSTNGLSALIENFDFYPLKSTDLNYFKFIKTSFGSKQMGLKISPSCKATF